MKRSLFVVALITVASPAGPVVAAPARWAVVVAVGDGATPRQADDLEARIAGDLLKTGRVSVLGRQHIQAVMNEQQILQSQFADPVTAAKVGKIVGATDVVYVELSLEDSSTNGPLVTSRRIEASASFSVISATTAEIVKSGVAQGTGERDATAGAQTTGSSLSLQAEAIADCADDLTTQVTQ